MATREYSNGEITIVWKSDLCQHAGICVKMLPQVYNPRERPWIKPEHASTRELIDQVSKCPSGALSIKEIPDIIIDQEDDGKKGRFVLYFHDQTAGDMTYTWAGKNKFIIDHTEVNPEYGGQGFGRILVERAVAFARQNHVKIIPLCPYATNVFRKHSELQDVLFSMEG